MRHATELAIAKAAMCGIGWVGTRMSNHAGAAATYPLMALAHDMIGLYMPVAQSNHMAPWGGAEALLGTNPIAVAIPALDEPPIVLDIATTQASNGRIALAAQNEEALQPGWMIDREGKPLLDARRAVEGLLLPIGGHKGAGLSLVFALLGASLNGAPVGRETENADLSGPSHTGQAIMVLNPAGFGPVEDFKRRVDKVARDLRTSQPLPGQGEVRYPGLQGHRTQVEREKSGIPLTPALRKKLDKLAGTVGVEPMKIG
jgi:L-2-hydroxycarboxylate dehydrogenase (NAD+)